MELAHHILVATDFSDAASHALAYGIELAGRLEARLSLLHVCESPLSAYSLEIQTANEAAARKQFSAILEDVRKRLPGTEGTLVSGSAGEEIAAQAKRIGADLIVIGTHGRRGLGHMILGSVAEKTLRLAHVPVLVLHRDLGNAAS
jgi:universal stress protein A